MAVSLIISHTNDFHSQMKENLVALLLAVALLVAPAVTPLSQNQVGGCVPKVSDAIDLGLSVKWAPWNLGASKPTDYGVYFMGAR